MDLVEALGIAEVERTLRRLTAKPHVVQTASAAAPVSTPTSVHNARRVYTQHDIDAIHLGLVKKQRQSGSLGLNR